MQKPGKQKRNQHSPGLPVVMQTLREIGVLARIIRVG